MDNDNRKKENEAYEFLNQALKEAEEKFGPRAASLGWLKHVNANVGHRLGMNRKWKRDNLPSWRRKPIDEQREALDLQTGDTLRKAFREAAEKGLTLAVDFAVLEIDEYGISVTGSFDEAIDKGAAEFSKAIGTVYHSGYDDENKVYVTNLQLNEEEQRKEEASLPLWHWMRGTPNEEAAIRYGYFIQYGPKGFRYIEMPDDGSMPPTWVDVDD